MDKALTGSWIGALVDQTGSGIALAAIVGEVSDYHWRNIVHSLVIISTLTYYSIFLNYSTEVTGTIMIILNSGWVSLLFLICDLTSFGYTDTIFHAALESFAPSSHFGGKPRPITMGKVQLALPMGQVSWIFLGLFLLFWYTKSIMLRFIQGMAQADAIQIAVIDMNKC